MTVEQFAMLQRIEAKLDTLLAMLADEEEGEPARTLDGEPDGGERAPGTPL
jgi:hypothetical protein